MSHSIPQDMLNQFHKGEHVCRHTEGLWYAVFLDQFGEQTYIRYGKGKGGLVGKTLSEEQTAVWTMSHHLCNIVAFAYDRMFEEEQDKHEVQTHKEEGKKRMNLDKNDRELVMKELKKYKNPLTCLPEDPLTNIVTGRIAADGVNVHEALAIGQQMSAKFASRLPSGFHAPLKKEVVTMEVSKKGVAIGQGKEYV